MYATRKVKYSSLILPINFYSFIKYLELLVPLQFQQDCQPTYFRILYKTSVKILYKFLYFKFYYRLYFPDVDFMKVKTRQ